MRNPPDLEFARQCGLVFSAYLTRGAALGVVIGLTALLLDWWLS